MFRPFRELLIVNDFVFNVLNNKSLKWVLYADNMRPKKGEKAFSTLNTF